MANICDYELRFYGGKLEKLQKILRKDNEVKEYNKMKLPVYGMRYESDILAEIEEGALVVSAGCRWSIASSMEERIDYYDLDGKKRKTLTIGDICRRYGVEAEAWSNEGGNCFAEHYEWDKEGNTIRSECLPFEEEYDEEEGIFRVIEKPEGFYEFKG